MAIRGVIAHCSLYLVDHKPVIDNVVTNYEIQVTQLHEFVTYLVSLTLHRRNFNGSPHLYLN